MEVNKDLKFTRLNCLISSDGRTATVVQNDRVPKLNEYKERLAGQGKTMGGKTYAERCYIYDKSRWEAIHGIKGREYPIEKFTKSILIRKGELYEGILTDDQTKIIIH